MENTVDNPLNCTEDAVFPPSPEGTVGGSYEQPVGPCNSPEATTSRDGADVPVGYPVVTGKVLHHIIPATFGSDHLSLARRLGGFNRRSGGFLLVTYHTADLSEVGHYHVVHSCSPANRCRCFEYGFGTVFGRRDFIAAEPVEDFSEKHWRNLYLYLEKGSGYRLVVFFQNGFNSPVKIVLQPGNVPLGSRGRTNEDAVSYEGFTPSLVREVNPSARATIAPEGELGSMRKRKARNSPSDLFQAAKEVAQLGWLLWTTSVPALLRHREITSKYSDILIMNKDALEKQATNAIALTFEQVKDWNFKNFKEELNNRGRKLTFNGDPIEITWGTPLSLKIMTIQDSADVIIRMLEHNAKHLNYLEKSGKRLFIDFIAWFDRQRGKKNTQLLVGPSNSCKTWFSKAWLRLAVYVGKISNPTRGETAPFSGAMESRIMFWDEADLGLDQSFSDICKMILGGQEVNVNIKYKNRQDLPPAPMLMCANRNPMRFTNKADVEAIQSRWHHLEWSCPAETRDLIYGECDPLALFVVHDWACGDLEIVDQLTPEELEDLVNAEVANFEECREVLEKENNGTISDFF